MAKTSKKKLPDAPKLKDDAPELPPVDDSTPETPPPTEDPAELQDEWPDKPEAPATAGEIETLAAETDQKNKGGRPTNEERRKRLPILERLMDLDSWDGVWVYLYRLRPVINKLMNGDGDTNIQRYDKPFDVQDILEEHGSGVYFVRATRQDPKTNKRPQFDLGEIKILNMKYPPRIPPGQWVEHPKNAEWEWAKEAIFGKPKPDADPITDMLNRQLERQERQMDELRKELRDNGKKDPAQETLLTAIAKRLMEPPPPPPDPTIALTKAIELVKAMQPPPAAESPLEKLAMAMLTKQLTEHGTPKDAAAELENVLKIQKQMEEQFGGRSNGSRSRKTGWQEVLSEVAGPLAEVLKPISSAFAMGAIQQQRAAQQQPGQPQQQQPQAPPAYTELPPPTAQQPRQPTGPQLVNKPTLEALAVAVIDHLEKRHTGLDLGDWYIDQYGQEEFDDVRLQGKAALMRDLQTVPTLYAYLDKNGAGDFERMITDFLTWTPPEDEDDDDEEEPAAAIQTIKTGWNAPANQEARP